MKIFALALLCACSGFSVAVQAHTQALNQLIYEIRDPQTDAYKFRNALEKIGEYLALEVMEELNKTDKSVTTLTGATAVHPIVDESPVLVTILRAGVPLNDGVLRVFPYSKVGFFAMSRDEMTLKPQVDYIALPDLRGRSVIIVDTMLATAGSLLEAIRRVEARGAKQIYIVAAIAAQTGIDRVLAHNPSIKVFAGSIDPILNDKGYIVPGLGDAGDRCYGKKYNAEE